MCCSPASAQRYMGVFLTPFARALPRREISQSWRITRKRPAITRPFSPMPLLLRSRHLPTAPTSKPLSSIGAPYDTLTAFLPDGMPNC